MTFGDLLTRFYEREKSWKDFGNAEELPVKGNDWVDLCLDGHYSLEDLEYIVATWKAALD